MGTLHTLWLLRHGMDYDNTTSKYSGNNITSATAIIALCVY